MLGLVLFHKGTTTSALSLSLSALCAFFFCSTNPCFPPLQAGGDGRGKGKGGGKSQGRKGDGFHILLILLGLVTYLVQMQPYTLKFGKEKLQRKLEKKKKKNAEKLKNDLEKEKEQVGDVLCVELQSPCAPNDVM